MKASYLSLDELQLGLQTIVVVTPPSFALHLIIENVIDITGLLIFFFRVSLNSSFGK